MRCFLLSIILVEVFILRLGIMVLAVMLFIIIAPFRCSSCLKVLYAALVV
jgi:hypothetical protein